MKKPAKWERVGNVLMAFDEWGMPIYYTPPIRVPSRRSERVVEAR
jgi:hypothetical protein